MTTDVKTNVIKRNGKEVSFDVSKIVNAITKANENAGQDGVWGIPSEISSQSPEVSADGIEPMVAAYMRWDGYEALGCPEIKTLEDWLPIMKELQEKIPELLKKH